MLLKNILPISENKSHFLQIGTHTWIIQTVLHILSNSVYNSLHFSLVPFACGNLAETWGASPKKKCHSKHFCKVKASGNSIRALLRFTNKTKVDNQGSLSHLEAKAKHFLVLYWSIWHLCPHQFLNWVFCISLKTFSYSNMHLTHYE